MHDDDVLKDDDEPQEPVDLDAAADDDLEAEDPLLAKKVDPLLVDPEEDHESLDALADEEEEEDGPDMDDDWE